MRPSIAATATKYAIRNGRVGAAVSLELLKDGAFTLEGRQAYTETRQRARFDRGESKSST
jgi:hypothetical protein